MATNLTCVCSALAVLCSVPVAARAQVFTSHYDVQPLHSASTSDGGPGSFAAAAMMGAQGFAGLQPPALWEGPITAQCTALSDPTTLWPAGCNPAGMVKALKQYSGDAWLESRFASNQQAAALDATLTAFQHFGSPVLVPIFGQADHWVTIWQVKGALKNGVLAIDQVFAYDGGNPNTQDSGGNGYTSGPLVYAAATWKSIYFKVVTAINPQCDADGCVSDPYFNKYVLLWEPPAGFEVRTHAEYVRSPGVLASGGMSPQVARSQLWRSLTLAGVDHDPTIWRAISQGEPGDGILVDGRFPDGSAWRYYLVPIYASPGVAIAFAQLSADDGAFEALRVLPAPAAFAPLPRDKAQRIAMDTLDTGEALRGGALRWDPRGGGEITKSPVLPYYEMEIVNGSKLVGTVRVALDNSMVVRL